MCAFSHAISSFHYRDLFLLGVFFLLLSWVELYLRNLIYYYYLRQFDIHGLSNNMIIRCADSSTAIMISQHMEGASINMSLCWIMDKDWEGSLLFLAVEVQRFVTKWYIIHLIVLRRCLTYFIQVTLISDHTKEKLHWEPLWICASGHFLEVGWFILSCPNTYFHHD